MEKFIFNENWSYRYIKKNIEVLKTHYMGTLASFLYFELHKKVVFMREVKNIVYKLHFEEWKKDKIWKYINGIDDVEF